MLFRLLITVLPFLCINYACQDKPSVEKNKPKEVTKKNVELVLDLVPPPSPKIDTTHYQYVWNKNYHIKNALMNQIDLPKGYKRVKTEKNTFGDWLRFLPLNPKGAKVHYFDGREKWTQKLHHRVVDLDVGKVDLQQCADAIMRLKAEYHYSQKEFKKIHFNYTSGDKVSFEDWRKGKKPIVRGNRVDFSAASGTSNNSYKNFRAYLHQIFNYAGTASLSKELRSLEMNAMQVGDLFIQGGHPGHAVLVMDMAENELGEKVYLLAQSYMPAQEFHILNNLENPALGPWHQLHDNEEQRTAEWNFSRQDLKRFK